VGIDPHPAILKAWGLSVDAAGLERCARGMVAALGETVAVFKPQSAFFEAHGAAGIAVLERTLADIAGSGALALLDVKRGTSGRRWTRTPPRT
jgi:orotidine-5'-phosphate decarboxylase